jgi:RimJ/RimL family protein N-acetyltransferase
MLHTANSELTLRELAQADTQALYDLIQANAAHLTANGDYAELVSASLGTLSVELAAIDGKRRFGVFLQDALVGRIDLIPVNPPHFGIGYWLAETATGKGHAGQALSAILQFAAEQQFATEVYAGITHGNVRSRNLLARLGFEEIAKFETYSRFKICL